MPSVFSASHSRRHWPVGLRCLCRRSWSIFSRSCFQRRYSDRSRPVMESVMSPVPPRPARRPCPQQMGNQGSAHLSPRCTPSLRPPKLLGRAPGSRSQKEVTGWRSKPYLLTRHLREATPDPSLFSLPSPGWAAAIFPTFSII